MTGAAVVAHHASARCAAAAHHVLHGVVAAYVTKNLLQDIDAGARGGCDLTNHGNRPGIPAAECPQAFQCAVAAELENNNLLLLDARKIYGAQIGGHGNINPCVVVKGSLGRGGAEKIDRVSPCARARNELIVIISFNQGATGDRGGAEHIAARKNAQGCQQPALCADIGNFS